MIQKGWKMRSAQIEEDVLAENYKTVDVRAQVWKVRVKPLEV